MIFASLGTHERPFYRLVKELGRLIKEREIKEKVIIQLGFTDYSIKGTTCYKFIDEKDMVRFVKDCNVMIVHGGLGSIKRGLEAGKPLVVVPRRKMFNEHTDDHQLQIIKETKKYGIIPVYDIKNLGDAIKKAKKLKVKKIKLRPTKIMNLVDKQLKEWGKQLKG